MRSLDVNLLGLVRHTRDLEVSARSDELFQKCNN
jgi:hypothetical protein